MKDASQILQRILETIGSIYVRPGMHAGSAEAIEDVLWHLHALWIDATCRDFDEFRETIKWIHGGGHGCNLSFVYHYRRHTKIGATASDDMATEFVIRTWKALDAKLGIVVPEPKAAARSD